MPLVFLLLVATFASQAGAAQAGSSLTIGTTNLAGTQYEAYHAVLTANGGSAPYTWAVASTTPATLPEGTSLDAATGIIAGTPTGSGVYSVTIQVTDASSQTATAAIAIPISGNQHLNGCTYFPVDNVWRQRIDGLPVHPLSAVWNSYYHNSRLHPDFGSSYGIPFMTMDKTPALLTVTVNGYPKESDFGVNTTGPAQVPFPSDAPIEGTNTAASDADRHVLALDTSTCLLYELYQGQLPAWTATSTANFDLNSNNLRPAGWTSTDAAGLPVTPGLVPFDEVQRGEIAHAIRMTMQHTTNSYLWPARHAAGLGQQQLPPMGARMRLRDSASVNARISRLSAANRVIAVALQHYGAFIADNGGSGFITGVPDARWDDADLTSLKASPVVAVSLSTSANVSSGSLLPFANVSQLRPGMWVQCHSSCNGIGVLGKAGPNPVIAAIHSGAIELSQPIFALVPAGTVIDFVDPDQACSAGPGFCLNDFDYIDESALRVSANSGATKPVVITHVLPGAVPGNAYTGAIAYTGGLPPLTCSVTVGVLPAGLRLDPLSCTISGQYSDTLVRLFTVTVKDSAGRSGSARFTIGYQSHRTPPVMPPPL